MSAPAARFLFDYVDPCSYLTELRLRSVESEVGVRIERHPFELVSPGRPLLDPRSGPWAERLRTALRARGPSEPDLVTPALVPWSRKAHELVRTGRELAGDEVADALHLDVFRALLEGGADLGRVDLLLDLATERGLDRAATKAALDVDRHAAALDDARRSAERLRAPGVPSILVGGRWISGIPDLDSLRRELENLPANSS